MSQCKCMLEEEKELHYGMLMKGLQKNPLLNNKHRAQRKRQCHKLQKQILIAKWFAMERSVATQGPWLDFETIVFVIYINTLPSQRIM